MLEDHKNSFIFSGFSWHFVQSALKVEVDFGLFEQTWKRGLDFPEKIFEDWQIGKSVNKRKVLFLAMYYKLNKNIINIELWIFKQSGKFINNKNSK